MLERYMMKKVFPLLIPALFGLSAAGAADYTVNLEYAASDECITINTNNVYDREGYMLCVDLVGSAFKQHVEAHSDVLPGDVFLTKNNNLIIFYGEIPEFFFVNGTKLGHLDNLDEVLDVLSLEDTIVEFRQ